MTQLLQRELGMVAYEPTLQAMKDLTDTRTEDSPDDRANSSGFPAPAAAVSSFRISSARCHPG